MIPADIPLSDIDPAVRNLVLNLNRVPGVYTVRTHDPQVWVDVPQSPTKDGIIQVYTPIEHQVLRNNLQTYCAYNTNFRFEPSAYANGPDSIVALFEPFIDEDATPVIQPHELEGYWTRALLREEELHRGIHELDIVVKQYIINDLGKDPSRMSFRGTPPQPVPRRYMRAAAA